ncbi:MAG: FAD-dependent oxidoreductase [Clostridia bacterium]|nr:FAD-dependent oxidoreductase [Clostridia bacterium]
MSLKVVIVGGVAGGASTAARLRRLDEKAEIIMMERGPYISFANCGLPYHIGGTIADREELLLFSPDDMKSRFNIDVRIWNEVVSIDRERKIVSVADRETGESYEESYDKLVLSPGSTPFIPPIPGIGGKNMFTLWTVPDMDRIISHIKETKPASAVVVGGGFIGLEMVENLRELGIEVSIVEMLDQVMQSLDYDMAQFVHRHLSSHHIRLFLGDGVDSFSETPEGLTEISLKSGLSLNAGIVILAIGVRPNSSLAVEARLETNRRGGIVVDRHLRTSDPDIYAVGDAIEVTHLVSGEKTMIPLAGPANKQGRICADNICGIGSTYDASQGTGVAKIFDITMASTGLNEKQLESMGRVLNKDFKATVVHPRSHSSYYPGAYPMTLKVLFDMKGKILGAQAVGYTGVEKRIDVIAASMRFNATIYDLTKLELSYAPPYSAAKDPVNMAGFNAENILNGICDNIQCRELPAVDISNTVILDVRTPMETESGMITGAVSIPLDDLRDRLGELDPEKEIIVYCAVGFRAYLACRILLQNGFKKVRNLAGGYTTYSTWVPRYYDRHFVDEPVAFEPCDVVPG